MRIQDGLQKVPESITAAVHALQDVSDGVGVAASRTEDVIKSLDLSIKLGVGEASSVVGSASGSVAAETVTSGVAATLGGVIQMFLPSTMGDPEADPHWREKAQKPKPKDP